MTDFDIIEACNSKKVAGQEFSEKQSMKQNKNSEFNMFNVNRSIILSLGNVERVEGSKP